MRECEKISVQGEETVNAVICDGASKGIKCEDNHLGRTYKFLFTYIVIK